MHDFLWDSGLIDDQGNEQRSGVVCDELRPSERKPFLLQDLRREESTLHEDQLPTLPPITGNKHAAREHG